MRAIKRSADSIDLIVRDLRDIAREPTLHLTDDHRVTALIAEAAKQSAAKHSKNDGPKTKYIWREPLFDCSIRADASELKSSLKCILDNAWEAIAERYRQDLDCKEGWVGAIKISVKQEGQGVSLVISDNGIGFEASERGLLFSPLYSTKTRLMEGKEKESVEKGIERIILVLNCLGWALSIDTDAERDLGEKDLTDAEITVVDAGRRAEIRIKHPSLANGEVRLARAVTASLYESPGKGLFSARRIIHQHGGLIQASSGGVFKGATFEIWLPGRS